MTIIIAALLITTALYVLTFYIIKVRNLLIKIEQQNRERPLIDLRSKILVYLIKDKLKTSTIVLDTIKRLYSKDEDMLNILFEFKKADNVFIKTTLLNKIIEQITKDIGF